MKRLSSVFILLSLLLIPLTIQSQAAERVYHTVDLQPTAQLSQSVPSVMTVPAEGTFDYDNPGYGAQLEDPIAIVAYNTLLSDLSPDDTKLHVDLSQFTLTNAKDLTTAVEAALSAFIFDHPESQYCHIISYGYGYTPNKAGVLTKISVDYIIKQDPDSASLKAALEEYAADFRDNFDFTLPVAEQYRVIHDHICQLAVYDHQVANCTDPQHDHAATHSAYGLLVHNIPVVCEGYAKAFKVLCDAVGLPCILINGEATVYTDTDGNPFFFGQTNHMWNAVEVDGVWYAVDSTWNDVDDQQTNIFGGLSFSFALYNYFLNNEIYSLDHRATGEIYYIQNFPMVFGLPDLSAGVCPGTEELTSSYMLLDYPGQKLQQLSSLPLYDFGAFHFSDIPNITIQFDGLQTFDAPFDIPEGKTYTLIGLSDSAEISAGECTSPLFTVSGTLELSGITLNELTVPLASVTGGTLCAPDFEEQFSYRLHEENRLDHVVNWQATYDADGRMTSLTNLGQLSTSTIYDRAFLFPANTSSEQKHFLLWDDVLSFFLPRNFDIHLDA